MTTFNIGTQNAANVQNVGGDMVIYGGVHASAAWQSRQLQAEIERARHEVARLPLEAHARSAVDRALACAAGGAVGPKGDKHQVADLLASATRTLREAGALATAGTGLTVALRRAAALLGPLGAGILALL